MRRGCAIWTRSRKTHCSDMPPAKCPFLHRCNKYTDLTLRIDRLEEAVAAKDRRIRALEEENARLRDAQCGGASEAASAALPFKSGTPSSKIPVKPNSSEEDRKRGREYDDESVAIRDELLAIAKSPVEDGRLKGHFDLMLQKRERFFQWVRHPEIEAENNLAERRLRPPVIARKVCFGSQSEKGLMTRETLMTIIDTLSLRCDDPVAKLSQVLDAIGRDRNADVSELLWGPKNAASEAAAA